MNIHALYAVGLLAGTVPFLSIFVILAHYFLLRIRWKRSSHLGKRRMGFCPSAVAMGMTFQFLQTYWQPSVSHVLEVRQQVDVEEDDDGDGDDPSKLLNRQLRRIRRGEAVERLVVRA